MNREEALKTIIHSGISNYDTGDHFMIDMETLSTGAHPVIPQICVVRFNPMTGETFENFTTNVNIQSCLDEGLEIDESTLGFWLSQDKSVRDKTIKIGEKRTIRDMLSWLGGFINNLSDTPVLWGKGPSFDMAKLANIYGKLDMDIPWKYWDEKCVRTVIKQAPQVRNIPFMGEKHHAFDDCRHQIVQVSESLNITLRGQSLMDFNYMNIDSDKEVIEHESRVNISVG